MKPVALIGAILQLAFVSSAVAQDISLRCVVRGQSVHSSGSVDQISEVVGVDVSEVSGAVFIFLNGVEMNHSFTSRSRNSSDGSSISAENMSSVNAWAIHNLSRRNGNTRDQSIRIDRRTGDLSYSGEFVLPSGRSISTSAQGICEAAPKARKF